MRARGLFAFLLVGAVVIGSCAAVEVERGGPGADGTPLVFVACAEEEPDCQGTRVEAVVLLVVVGVTAVLVGAAS